MTTTDTDPRGDYALCRRLLDEIDALRRETEAAWLNAPDQRAEVRAVSEHLGRLDLLVIKRRAEIDAAEHAAQPWRGSTARLRANTKEAR